MRVAPTRTYRGVPVEHRRALRRERLIEAGLEEIGTRRYDNITVKDVCRRAGLTERYFYEHFSDRAALLVGVFDAVIAIVTAAAFAASDAAPPDLEERTRAGLTAFVDALTDPRSLAPFPGMLSEPPGADPHAGWCGRGQGKPGLYPIRCGGGRQPQPVRPARAAQLSEPPADPTSRASGCPAVRALAARSLLSVPPPRRRERALARRR